MFMYSCSSPYRLEMVYGIGLHVLFDFTNIQLLQTKNALVTVWDSIAQGKLLYGRVTLQSQPEKHEADRAEFDHYEDKASQQKNATTKSMMVSVILHFDARLQLGAEKSWQRFCH